MDGVVCLSLRQVAPNLKVGPIPQIGLIHQNGSNRRVAPLHRIDSIRQIDLIHRLALSRRVCSLGGFPI